MQIFIVIFLTFSSSPNAKLAKVTLKSAWNIGTHKIKVDFYKKMDFMGANVLGTFKGGFGQFSIWATSESQKNHYKNLHFSIKINFDFMGVQFRALFDMFCTKKLVFFMVFWKKHL